MSIGEWKKKKCKGPCDLVKSVSEFSAQKTGKSGIRSRCKFCESQYQKTNRDKLHPKRAKYRKDHPEYMAKARKDQAEWDKKNPDYKKQWRKDNRDTISARSAKFYLENIDMMRTRNAKSRAARLQRTVAWADDWKIKQFYIMARKLTKIHGVEFHVDHIVPLQGKLVSGLHVENNLQIITATENLRKNNSFIPG